MEQSEVIVEIGGEGGSLAIYGIRTKLGWIFSREVVDQSLLFIDEGPTIQHSSKIVSSWPEALELLDRYPWPQLCPIKVHPEFRKMVLDAVLERNKAKGNAKSPGWKRAPKEKREIQFERWEELCSIVGGEPTFRSFNDSEDYPTYDDDDVNLPPTNSSIKSFL